MLGTTQNSAENLGLGGVCFLHSGCHQDGDEYCRGLCGQDRKRMVHPVCPWGTEILNQGKKRELIFDIFLIFIPSGERETERKGRVLSDNY